MPKYTTKPFTIEAVQWKGWNVSEIKAFVGKNDNDEDAFLLPDEIAGVWDDPHVWDYLQKTWVAVNDNDYIIKGMKGEFYPCDADVFEAKYQEVPTVVSTNGNITWYSDGSMEIKEVHNG